MTQTDRVDGFIGDSAIKAPVRAASTGVLVLTGEQTVDGVALVTGDRVLVKNQVNSIANGIYVVDSGAWSRAHDFDGTYDIVKGTLVRVTDGSLADSFWAISSSDPLTIGSSNINFTQVNNSLLGVSAFIQTLLDDATAVIARATLGAAAGVITTKGDLYVGGAAGVEARKAVGALEGSALITDPAQIDGLLWLPQYPNSLAPNPFFAVDQRVNSATSRADDTYASDRWYVLTQSNPINVTTQTVQENGQMYNVRMTQANASAQRMGYATILEGKDCKHLRGSQVTFRPRVRISASQPVRIAVLEWTGTEDAVTSDVVNDWSSADYSDGAAKFFVDANFTPSGNGAKTPGAATWTDMDALTVTLGSTFTNLVLVVWTEGTAAQNVTLDIGKVRFVRGAYAGEILVPSFADEYMRALRYYWKSFPYTVAPAQNVGLAQGGIGYTVNVAGVGVRGFHVQAPIIMRTDPSRVFYNLSNTNANWRNTTDGADSGAVGVTRQNEFGALIQNTQVAADDVGDTIAVHTAWSADL